MFNKFEKFLLGTSLFAITFGVYLTQIQSTLSTRLSTNGQSQSAQLVDSIQSNESSQDMDKALTDVPSGEIASVNDINNMVIEDVKLGSGEAVKVGDTVAVHYSGALKGEVNEFDNSRKRGEPLEFTVGNGMVIKGWDEGLIGMKVGGQRVLVIPPHLAYGESGIGPIPPNSTLVFSIELVEIK